MRIATFVSLLLLLAAMPAFSQQHDAVASTKEVSPALQQLEMASKLVRYGRDTKSALPLIQAVQIYRDMNIVDEANAKGSSNPYAEATLLADAEKFADGNKTLLNLIKETKMTTRAGFGEPNRYFRVIEAGETIQQSLYAAGPHYLQVVVDGQGEGVFSEDSKGNKISSDLRLMVLDDAGRVIASDQSRGVNCAVAFMSRTSNMTIVVRNVGQMADNCIIYVYRTKLNP